MGLPVCLEVLEVLESKVCPDPLDWMDLMASVELKVSQEPQVRAAEVARVLTVYPDRREKEAIPTQEVQDSPERREREESRVVLDSQGSPVCQDPPVRLWGLMYLDQLETPASLDWMENMVSKVLQVLPGHLVQAQPRETEVTLGSPVFPAPPAEKETQEAPEGPDSPAAPVSKDYEVKLATAEVPVLKVTPVTLVDMEAKEPGVDQGSVV